MALIKDKHDKYTYRVTWSEDDAEYVGLCTEFPSLSWLAQSPEVALKGICKLVNDVVADMRDNGETVPELLTTQHFSSKCMSRKLRRTDRGMTETEARELLERGEYGVLSTVSADGAPYGVPVNYCVIGDGIYFHCALEGHKLENIAAESRVSFCVVGTTRLLPEKFSTLYESVIVAGRAAEVTGVEKQRGLEELVAKYSAGFREAGERYIASDSHKTRVFRIDIDAISGKARR